MMQPETARLFHRMGQRLDFKRLRYFVGIVEAASISTAASQLGVAQPALSKALRSLEDDLGMQLLERNARGVQVTQAGALFHAHCQTLLGELEQACDALMRSVSASEVVRIGVPFSVGMVLVAPLLQTIAQLMPTLQIDIVERHTPELQQALLEHKLDLAMVSPLDCLPELHYEPLVSEGMFLAASVALMEGKLAGAHLRDPLQMAQLQDLPLLFSQPSTYLRLMIDKVFASQGMVLRDVREIDMFATLLNYVSAGEGCSILPAGWIHREVKSGRIRALAFADAQAMSRVIYLCRARRVTPNASTLALWRMVRIAADRAIRAGDWMSARLMDPC